MIKQNMIARFAAARSNVICAVAYCYRRKGVFDLLPAVVSTVDTPVYVKSA
jgi:hypothetical protein